MARRSIWERLHESTEGPTVTISLPREWAEELMRSLMTSLEIDDDGDQDMEDPDLDMGDDAEDDDGAGIPGMDDDFLDDEPGFSAGDEGDDVPDFAAGDDDDDEDDSPAPPKKKGPPKKDKEKSKEKDDDSDDDEKDEAADYGQTRPATALGESAFARLAGRLSARKPVRGRRR